jgi:hypothetical protein
MAMFLESNSPKVTTKSFISLMEEVLENTLMLSELVESTIVEEYTILSEEAGEEEKKEKNSGLLEKFKRILKAVYDKIYNTIRNIINKIVSIFKRKKPQESKKPEEPEKGKASEKEPAIPKRVMKKVLHNHKLFVLLNKTITTASGLILTDSKANNFHADLVFKKVEELKSELAEAKSSPDMKEISEEEITQVQNHANNLLQTLGNARNKSIDAVNTKITSESVNVAKAANELCGILLEVSAAFINSDKYE